ncbi:VOC family protein [Sphingomonas xinjiangensis]|uniref:VOC domain-containing protein n=1 Tax=Sphingomonas xinjiangensis TaxID=643568 RepID=A0A840YL87_9SPHN|nr:VOC family protein [Sphingomonas xinjiangensis]MBB5709990.1 hypothetical protein [Sphingomonas xinjiangensis]
MSNPHGTPIWYELTTSDPQAAAAFYTHVVGWSAAGFGGAALTSPEDYCILTAPDGQGVGGVTTSGKSSAFAPGWGVYIGVNDVDFCVDQIVAAGGKVLDPPTTLEGVGRTALVSDPQGISFHLMRGASPEPSHAFDPKAVGRCAWHELMTPDDHAALVFYADQFGWTPDGAMPMGDMGAYSFVAHQGVQIGAMMRTPPGERSGWQFYFRITGIDAAHARVEEARGAVHMGPMEVPGGEWIVVASDPQGARFGLVGTRS